MDHFCFVVYYALLRVLTWASTHDSFAFFRLLSILLLINPILFARCCLFFVLHTWIRARNSFSLITTALFRNYNTNLYSAVWSPPCSLEKCVRPLSPFLYHTLNFPFLCFVTLLTTLEKIFYFRQLTTNGSHERLPQKVAKHYLGRIFLYIYCSQISCNQLYSL